LCAGEGIRVLEFDGKNEWTGGSLAGGQETIQGEA